MSVSVSGRSVGALSRVGWQDGERERSWGDSRAERGVWREGQGGRALWMRAVKGRGDGAGIKRRRRGEDKKGRACLAERKGEMCVVL